MIAKLSDEQRRVLQDRHGAPVFVEDTETHTQYVIVAADAYRRVQTLFEDDDFDVVELSPLMDEVAQSIGWDDPEMDVYNDYDSHRPNA